MNYSSKFKQTNYYYYADNVRGFVITMKMLGLMEDVTKNNLYFMLCVSSVLLFTLKVFGFFPITASYFIQNAQLILHRSLLQRREAQSIERFCMASSKKKKKKEKCFLYKSTL